MKKAVPILIILLLISSLVFSASAEEITSFSDVPETHWAYSTVMKAVDRGLFRGTSEPDANGVGTFAPDNTMTRAEFITVCMRALRIAPTNYKGSGEWYAGYWDAAVSKGIISPSVFDLASLNQPMTREEMAYAAVQTLKFKGEEATELIFWDTIPDMDSVQRIYQPFVLSAYSMGILCGVDDFGTFNPKGTLNRAQAATVLVRIVEADSRKPISKEKPSDGLVPYHTDYYGQVLLGYPGGTVTYFEPIAYPDAKTSVFKLTYSTTPQGALTIHEGEVHYRTLRAGDTIIKEDGTEVVLNEFYIYGIHCIGLGQGVDVYSGYTDNGITLNMNDGKKHGAGELYNGGDATTLSRCWNGEVRSGREIDYILTYHKELGFTKPTTPGAYDGEHRNLVWRWTATSEVEENFTPQWMYDF